MITFHNPTVLDLRLITTFGVNVKPASQNPIGHFGTGLKYVIAVLLRTGHEIVLETGRHEAEFRFEFKLRSQTIRGKEFGIVLMVNHREEKELAFTTELGKNWEVWMAFRELYSNALDEGGGVVSGPGPEAETRLHVSGLGIEEVYANRADYFLDTGVSAPRWRLENVHIHDRPSSAIFMRGIRVLTLQKPSLFTYDLQIPMTLTEDRQLQSTWDLRWTLSSAIAGATDPRLLQRCLRAKKDSYESEFTYQYSTPSKEFEAETANLHRANLEVNATAVEVVRGKGGMTFLLKPATATTAEGDALKVAIAKVEAILDRPLPYKVQYAVQELDSTLKSDTIWLKRSTDPEALAIAILCEVLSEDYGSGALKEAARLLVQS